MPSFASIRRYYLLYEKVSHSHYPSFQDLMEWFIENDCDISVRTLQRDLMRMRYDFGIEVAYSKPENGYYIDSELSVKPDVFLRFLEVIATAGMLADTIRDSRETLRHIQFEAQGSLKGIEMLPKLLKAIKESREIVFIHHNFFTGKDRKYRLKPYFVKEYVNRWYVIGKPFDSDDFLTYGIDRISGLELTKQSFVRTDETPDVLFENVVGVTWNPHEVKKVVFSIFKPCDNYVRTLPLHSSQKLISEDDIQSTFEIEVVVNHELMQRFLMLGNDCEVIKPKSLRKRIHKMLKQTLKYYK